MQQVKTEVRIIWMWVTAFVFVCFTQPASSQVPCQVIDWERPSNASFENVARFIEEAPQRNIQSVVVIREGQLEFEAYPNRYATNTLHDIRSAAKSITSLLIGIAVDQGSLVLDDPLLSFFPEYEPVAGEVDERKKRITVAHLLTMASGLYADADDADSPGNENYLEQSEDWVQFALEIPMIAEPGSRWSYASVNSFLLGVIVEKATGQQLEDFAQTYLFDPLGIEGVRWTMTPNGYVVGQGNLYISARALARIGQMILNDGCWDGKQVVSKKWLQQSFEGRYPVYWDNYDTYGYQWYNHTLMIGNKPYRYVFASGNGGQKLYIVPDSDLVVVIQTTAYNTRYGQRRSLEIFKRILEASG